MFILCNIFLRFNNNNALDLLNRDVPHIIGAFEYGLWANIGDMLILCYLFSLSNDDALDPLNRNVPHKIGACEYG